MTRWVPPAAVAAASGALTVGAWDVAVAAVGPARRHWAPALSGQSRASHIALTFDDGPDESTTPLFLVLLARFDRRASFFLLGEHVWDQRDLVREMSRRGHDLAVHGWDHRCAAAAAPARLSNEMYRTSRLLTELTGQRPLWYRPPYGVHTGHSRWAASRLGLSTVLWTAWGRDWERRATPASVVRGVRSTLRPGGTVLLHDSDRISGAGSAKATLAATEILLQRWRDSGVDVGPLRDHWGR